MKFTKEFVFGVKEEGTHEGGVIKRENAGNTEVVYQGFDAEFPQPQDERERSLNFVLNSWDSDGEHPEFEAMRGKKVRVTLEVIED